MMDLIERAAAQTELMMKCERYTLARESHGMGHVEWSSDLISVADAMDAIRDLPSAQPEPQWIPVSKKSHPDTPERVQVQLDNGWIITAYYEGNEWLSVPYCDEPIEDRWIEAWMPLPEPYRAERRADGSK